MKIFGSCILSSLNSTTISSVWSYTWGTNLPEAQSVLEVSIQTAVRWKGATANTPHCVAELLFASFCNGLVLPRLPRCVSFLLLHSCSFTCCHLCLSFLPFSSSRAVFSLFLGLLEHLTLLCSSPLIGLPPPIQKYLICFLLLKPSLEGCAGLLPFIFLPICCHSFFITCLIFFLLHTETRCPRSMSLPAFSPGLI